MFVCVCVCVCVRVCVWLRDLRFQEGVHAALVVALVAAAVVAVSGGLALSGGSSGRRRSSVCDLKLPSASTPMSSTGASAWLVHMVVVVAGSAGSLRCLVALFASGMRRQNAVCMGSSERACRQTRWIRFSVQSFGAESAESPNNLAPRQLPLAAGGRIGCGTRATRCCAVRSCSIRQSAVRAFVRTMRGRMDNGYSQRRSLV